MDGGESAVETRPTRVLLVEDQPQLLRSLEKLLSGHPSEIEVVGTALDGETGLLQARSLAPDLVLLDLELPGIDGIEVTARLKRAQPEVDVLILTSFDDETKVFEAMKAGASGYLVKRVGIERILSAIREVRLGGVVLEPIIARRFWNYFHSAQARPPQPVNRLGLSDVELDVLRFVAKGLSNAEVGRVMNIERRTVRTHLSHIYKRLGVNTHVEAVIKALGEGLVEI
jgi:DNA-binding NarL/FixJ family response regulator